MRQVEIKRGQVKGKQLTVTVGRSGLEMMEDAGMKLFCGYFSFHQRVNKKGLLDQIPRVFFLIFRVLI